MRIKEMCDYCLMLRRLENQPTNGRLELAQNTLSPQRQMTVTDAQSHGITTPLPLRNAERVFLRLFDDLIGLSAKLLDA